MTIKCSQEQIQRSRKHKRINESEQRKRNDTKIQIRTGFAGAVEIQQHQHHPLHTNIIINLIIIPNEIPYPRRIFSSFRFQFVCVRCARTDIVPHDNDKAENCFIYLDVSRYTAQL